MRDTGIVAVVPLRSAGKTRLRAELTPGARERLAAAMLADVVAALRGAGITRIILAAGGRGAAEAARPLGVEVIPDVAGRPGLSIAVDTAAARAGEAAVLTVAGDLPTLAAADVLAVLARPEPVVVAPTGDGGTGGLLRRPGLVIAAAYGPGSARTHLDRAAAAGLPSATVHAPGFVHDVDTWHDLRSLPPQRVGVATRRQLRPTPERPSTR